MRFRTVAGLLTPLSAIPLLMATPADLQVRGPTGAAVGHLESAPTTTLRGDDPETGDLVETADGCDILILWHTKRSELDFHRAQVKVRGAPGWSYLVSDRLSRWWPAGYVTRWPCLVYGCLTDGVTWNWKWELKQKRCDLRRRYRFKIVGLEEIVGAGSNEPYVGVERWLYFPSETRWTQKTHIDVGYLDLCLRDGTKCSSPYYPSGPTRVLSKD